MEIPTKFRSVSAGFCYWLLALVLLASSMILISCGGDDTTITITGGGVGAADTLVVNAPTSVETGDAATISVLATAAGVAVDGETITFTINPNLSGSNLSALSAVTVNGEASVTYTAGAFNIPTTDVVTIQSTNVTVVQNIGVVPPGIGSIEVSATSDTIEAITVGNNQTTILATVKDKAGALMESLNISFTTTSGSLCAAPAPASCNATQPVVATTDVNGIARVTLQSSTSLGTATVQAQAPDLSTDSTDVTFIAGTPANILLTANPINITAKAGNISTITALVTDSAGHTVADGENEATFAVTAGTANIDPLPVETVGGLAANDLVVAINPTPGSVDILVTAGNVSSSISITLIAEIVGSVTVSISPSTLTANGSDFAVVEATVRNTNNALINDGTWVSFATLPSATLPSGVHPAGDLAAELADLPVTPGVGTDTVDQTTVNGVATVYLQASIVTGNYSVSATSGGRFNAASYAFVPGVAYSGNSSLAVNPNSIDANGATRAELTLNALDVNSNPVADGTSIQFSTNEGTFLSSGTANTTATTNGGVATATIISSNTPTNPVNLSAFIDDGSGVTAATSMVFTASATVDPSSIELSLSGGRDGDGKVVVVESPGGSTPAIITANVYDALDNLIPNNCTNNIVFSIVSGPAVKLDGATPPVTKSTLNGSAQVELSAGSASGTVRVGVAVTKNTSDCSVNPNLSATTTAITIASGAPANLVVFGLKIGPNPDGTISQTINAFVTDSYGNAVEDGTAVFFLLDAAGSNYGLVCGTAFTGDGEMDTSCTPGIANTIKGVAHSLLTYAPDGVGFPYQVTAETTSGTSGATTGAVYLPYP